METVFHVPHDDHDDRAGALRNVANLLADETHDGDVTVVCNAGGIEALLADGPHADAARGLHANGVRLALCSNTLAGTAYDEADLLDGVELVSSAMAELTRLQTAGAAYIRP